MKLSEWMKANDIDDEALAKRIVDDGVRCDRTQVSRYRREVRRPEWPVIECISRISGGAVTANDWMSLEGAR